MPTPLSFAHGRRADGTPVLTAIGEIDMSNAKTFAAELDRDSGPLVVDLVGVEYLDSAGLSLLLQHADRLELIATSLLEPVLELSGLAELTTIHRA
ncbi:STAS domain-containing protein [Nocardia sp. NPDC003482]|uniref:STAS domain-containing protein n=1 Tax=Nocardia sp. NPDC004068 TaxID=3364303 RepID=UPI0036ABA92E